MIPEGRVSIAGGQGPALEGALARPAGAKTGVVVCHPHPQYGGDMDSAVVVAAVQACSRANLATLRFNFRGVGGSAGAWDEGRGEQDDVRAAVSHLLGVVGTGSRVALAGYSFGAAMAASVAAQGERLAGLALIAPPLAMRRLPPTPPAIDGPVHVVAGRADTYCPPDALAALARAWPAATITVIDGADHFFFGGLDALTAAVADWAGKVST